MEDNKFVKFFTIGMVVLLVCSISVIVWIFGFNYQKMDESFTKFKQENFGGTPEKKPSTIPEVEKVTKVVKDENETNVEVKKDEPVVDNKETTNKETTKKDSTNVETSNQPQGLVYGDELKQVAGLSDSEFAAANVIIANCGIMAYGNVYAEGEFNGKKKYNIDSYAPKYTGLTVYFDNNNVLQRIRVNESELYFEGKQLYKIDDFLFTEEEMELHVKIVLEDLSKKVNAECNFADEGAFYSVENPDKMEVKVFGVMEYTDNSGKIVKKNFETYITAGLLVSSEISDFVAE